MPDEHHGAVDLALVVQAVDVAGDALEEPLEDAPVRLALIGEVGELALGEHGAAARDGDAVRAGLRQLDGLIQGTAEPGAQAFHRLARARRATLVGLVAHVPGRGAREHRVAAAADPDHVERPVRVEPGGGLLLGDLLGHASHGRLAEALAVDAGHCDARQTAAAQLAVELEEGAERIAEVALRPRLQHAELAVRGDLAHGQRGGHLAEIGADEERRVGERAVPVCRAGAAS